MQSKIDQCNVGFPILNFDWKSVGWATASLSPRKEETSSSGAAVGALLIGICSIRMNQLIFRCGPHFDEHAGVMMSIFNLEVLDIDNYRKNEFVKQNVDTVHHDLTRCK